LPRLKDLVKQQVMLSVEFVSNSGNVGAFDKYCRGGAPPPSEEKRKKGQPCPWIERFNCARRCRAVAEVSFDGVLDKRLMKSRFERMAEPNDRPQEAVVDCYQWSG
jgi:hypothetical protein